MFLSSDTGEISVQNQLPLKKKKESFYISIYTKTAFY